MQSANASELTTDIAVIGGGASRHRRDRQPAETFAGVAYQPDRAGGHPLLPTGLDPGRWRRLRTGRHRAADGRAGPARRGWLRTRVERVDPEARRLLLEGGDSLEYRNLIVCPGLRLAWERIEGLEETLGRNGVTSNYRYDLAPYTWELVRGLRGGKALFTQPAMPIKCAGAPQKAMYLSCDHWLREGVLQDIEVEFDLAGAALFGVADFVPPLMEYVRKYSAELAFNSNLVKVDGAARKAWFEVKDADGNTNLAEKDFDLLHVVPPQLPPTFVAASGLGDAAGWCEVDPATLQHVRHGEIFALGDVCGTANAKTAAAARKQIVVVAENLLGLRSGVACRCATTATAVVR